MNIQVRIVCILFALQSLSDLHAGDSLKLNSTVLMDFKWANQPAGLHVHFEGWMNSTALPAAISNAFLFRKYISNEQKNIAGNQLQKNENILGGGLKSGFMFGWTPDSIWKRNRSFAGFSYALHLYQSIRFSKNLFDIMMQGNAPFAGSTLAFSNEMFYAIQFQTIKFHYFKNWSNSTFQAAMGLALGSTMSNINIRQASLFTETGGTYLDISMAGRIFTANSSDNTLRTGIPSAGPVVDFRYCYSGKNIGVLASIENLGFINWNEQSRTYFPDTSVRFTGIQIDDVFQIENQDSLVERITGNAAKGKEMYMLPASLRASIVWKLNEASALQLSFNQLMIPGYSFQKSLAYHFTNAVSKRNTIGFQLGICHGGFGNLNSFLKFTPLHTRHHTLQIGSMLNEGWIRQKSWRGNGIVLSYHWTP